MHFVYPYVRDALDGDELRYSLRGLEQHYVDDEIVPVVVGDLPSWANVNVRWIPSPQRLGDPAFRIANVVRSVYRAMVLLAEEGVKQAVVLDDDHILLDHVTSVMPCWVSSWAKQMNQVREFEPKKQWLKDGFLATRVYLRDVTFPRSFEIHRPMPVRPAALADLLEPHVECEPQLTPLWRSLWGNLEVEPSAARQARDVRATDVFPRGTAWVSTDEKYGWDRMQRHIAAILPERSKWER